MRNTGKLVVAVLIAAAAIVAVRALRSGSSAPGENTPKAAQVLYHCPMHPSYVSDKPGDCPICGMRLVAADTAAPTTGPSASTLDRSRVRLDPERLRMLGVRSEEAVLGDAGFAIRTVGRIAVDERRVHHIHTKFEGYIEALYVDFTGKFVRQGEPLASIYSPELLATQEEYLLALRAQEKLGASQVPSVVKGGTDLLEAARRRLLLWDISPATIDRLERTGEVRRSLELFAPMSGYVVAKTAVHGMRATPADALFDIADLSHLWVLADVYEQDLASVQLGMPASLSVTYLPGRTWTGNVTWVAPTVEPQTRTIKVRVEVDNSDQVLKPEMFADVALQTPARQAVLVPAEALIRSGQRNLVFVDEGDGVFTPREVRLGRQGSAGVEIASGLRAGERVVTAANFLLDSESSLKAALEAMAPAAGAERPPETAGAAAGGLSAPASTPAHVHSH